jgi:DNA polymerase-3 subunit alpha
MLTAFEEILDRSQVLQKRRGEAQISMFAASLKEEEPYPEIDEFPEKQLIAFEKETIGFYFSRHPLAHYQEVIKRMAQEDSLTLWERPNGSEVKICGLVSGLKEITTKKGDRMAFLTLEDMKGFVEVILFPEVFKASLNLLRSGDPIIIRGILDLSDEQQAKIKGMEVLPLSEASSSPPRTVHIRIPVPSLTSARLEDLKAVILGHQGSCNIRLHFTNGNNGETVIALSDQYTVEPSPAFQNTLMHLFESATLSLD